MKLKIQGVPAGQYTALFNGVEQTSHPEYGEGLIWRFVVSGGQFDGQIAQRVTGPQPKPQNSCGKLLRGVVGSLPSVGNEVDLEQFINVKYSILVEEATNGGTRVGSVIPLSDENG